MSKKSLIDEFNVSLDYRDKDTIFLKDYDIFTDKVLLDDLRKRIIQNIIDNNINYSSKEEINNSIENTLQGIDLSNLEINHLYNLIDNEINGYGPITELLNDKNITEIMVNSPKDIYIEIDGKIVKDETVSFINEEHILRIIQKIVQPIGKTIDSTNPMVDSRLPDGSRINAIIPPLSLNGPVLTIRKFRTDLNTINDLLRNGTLTNEMALFLENCVLGKANIIVCGGTGSGKTTLLNVLSSFIKESERIITIEDAAELKLNKNHVISLETRNSNYDSKNVVTIRDLVRNSLRMRPDRIVIGEVRGAEAFDMLQAMNTGHEGSLTTLHANSPIDCLNRLETMVMLGEEGIPVNAIRDYIGNAIDLVINIERLSDGKRKITSISEVTGCVNQELELKRIFGFKQKGLTLSGEVNGEYFIENYKPKLLDKLHSKGLHDIDYMFENVINNKVDKKIKKQNNKKQNYNKQKNNK